jgi:3-oxoacyl-[acyl-carrier protein] reductase
VIAERFSGQVAVVTGGASGLGRSVAHRLAEEGANVVLFDADTDGMNDTVRGMLEDELDASTIAVDVTDEVSVEQGYAAVLETYGQVDVVVNCAGIVGPNGMKIVDVPTGEFDDVINVNLKGSFLIAKHAVQAMLPRNYGRVLLVASIAGKEGNPGMVGYSTSKAGVVGLVKAAGKEYAETGITINGLAPAVIRTPMVDATDPKQVDYMTSKIPMKRCGTLDEVAALVCWIVSEEASFNTGFVFDLTGGRATY